MPTDLLLDFYAPEGSYRLTIEDDGKVAYAYLKDGSVIVGYVWLYNHCPAPGAEEWSDQKNIPFANCEGYMKEGGRVIAAVDEGDLLVDWETDEKGPLAYVYLFEDLYGVVGVYDKPGVARYASKDGPLARVMRIE